MKKVAFFSKNLEIGGMEKALVNLLNSLVDKYDIYLFLEEKKGPLLQTIDSKIHIIEYKISTSKNVIKRKIINFSKRFSFYLKYHNKFYFSCSYATYSVICSKLALVSSKNNSLYIHSNYVQMYKDDLQKLKNFFLTLNLTKFKKVFFVSTESMDKMIKIYPSLQNRAYVVNNLIDGKKVIDLSKEKCDIFNNKKINILYVGRLDKTSKNFDLLIDTFNNLIKLNKNAFLTILGSGNDEEYIKKLIGKYNINDFVKMVKSDINPYKYMKNADSLILTSYYEGFPVIYLESLVLNKNVFTTVPTSDYFIDTRNYFNILSSNAKDNANIINNNLNKKIDYGFNYKKYNDYMLNKFIDRVEEE